MGLFGVAAGLHESVRPGLAAIPEHVVSKDLKFGYQLVVADLNGDGKKDLIAVDERATQLLWFENQHPAWERHVLAVDVPRPLNADCWDVDGDGVPEVVLAYRFEPSPEKSVGNVVLLHSGADVRQPWTARENRPCADRAAPCAGSTRRAMGRSCSWWHRWSGRRYLPGFDDPVPIYVYRPGPWKRETLSRLPQGVLHAICPVPCGTADRGNQCSTCKPYVPVFPIQ